MLIKQMKVLQYLTLVDIFSLSDYLTVCKINKEIAIFIGADSEDNETVHYY